MSGEEDVQRERGDGRVGDERIERGGRFEFKGGNNCTGINNNGVWC